MTLHKLSPTLFLLAGLLPILVAHLAYALNLAAGLQGCNPYWDGCLSVSRAVRSGPGLVWFKASALPIALAMALAWWGLQRPLFGRALAVLGTIGAIACFVYAMALGTDGEFYKWMRRYGVVFYFAMTGLAQLLLARRLQKLFARQGVDRQSPRTRVAWRLYLGVLLGTWGAGVLSAFKRRMTSDPDLVDRLENVLEWFFALGLSLGFLALALLLFTLKKPAS